MKLGRANIFGCILVILLLISVNVTFAQDEPSETFLRELERLMVQDGWETSEMGELNRYLHTYRYENLEGVDPEVVALALQYARGRNEESLDVPAMAMIAAQVMNSAGEMAALGFENRTIAAAVLEGVREMFTLREQLQTGESSPETALQLKEQLRLQVKDCQNSELKSRIRTRTRTSNPHDPEEWTPPGPGGIPGGNDTDGSPGPGPGSGTPGVDNPGTGQQTGS